MKKLFRVLLIFFLTINSCGLLNAQATNNDSADSLQRVAMRDSLGVSDTIVSHVFAIRNNFRAQSENINSDTSLNSEQKKDAMVTLISQTNNGIKALLGETAYEHYKQMIRRKAANRPGGNNIQPLASQSGGN